MGVKLNTASGGSVSIEPTNTASNYTLTVPAQTGTVATLTTPSFTSTIGVGGATASASGAGITFPATQSASSDANTLDDYEEGTWTPVLARTGSSYTQISTTGTYVKIGKQVTVNGYLQITAVGTQGSSYVRVNGFPFTSGSISAGAVLYNTAISTVTTSSAVIFNNDNAAYLMQSGRFEDPMVASITTGYLGFSLTYFI